MSDEGIRRDRPDAPGADNSPEADAAAPSSERPASTGAASNGAVPGGSHYGDDFGDHGDHGDHGDQIADSLAIDDVADENPPPHAPSATAPLQPGPQHAAPPPGPTPPGQPPAAVPPSANRPRRSRRGRKQHKKAPWWELPALVALAILIAILVKSFLVQPFYIPSQSMEKTLHGCPGCSGDRILVSKVIYDFRDPHPGDIVVFNAPTGWDDEPPSTPPSNPVVRAVRGFGQLVGFVPPDGLVLVKRVIATGGQTVRGFAKNGHDVVQISDHGTKGPWRTLHETYVYQDGPDGKATFGPITVPKGRLWVMGDHRNESADSRYHCGDGGGDGPDTPTACNTKAATVPISDVIGKAVLIVWPPSRWTTLGTPKTFEQASAALAGSGLLPAAAVLPVFWLVRRRRRR
jgi:signal peptidase I